MEGVINSVGTVSSQQHLQLMDMEDPTETIEKVCAALDTMIDAGAAPDLVLDYSNGGINSEVMKSLSLSLGLPTVSSTMGEQGDIE